MRIIFTLFIFTAFSLKVSAQEPNKIALIVAISKYPANSGWGELSSENDVKQLKHTSANNLFPNLFLLLTIYF